LKTQADPVGQARLRQTALEPQGADFPPDFDVLDARAALSRAFFWRFDQFSLPGSRLCCDAQ
jgi:hypothetical protein